MLRKIIQNKIQCNYCKEILISHYRHDFKMCKCGKVGIDGGTFYLRRVGVGYTENSVIDDGKFETQREVCEWGKNYDKRGRLLKKTKWIKIKDLDTDHIYNILMKVRSIDNFYKRLLEDEIIYREELILNKK